MFFLAIDAHSKWPEIFRMSSTTMEETIVVLRCIFASFGLPDQLVSDNGPQFTACEFADFVSANSIRHIRTAPYHFASNGTIERFIQTFEQAMKAGEGNGFVFPAPIAEISHGISEHTACKYWEVTRFIVLGRPIRMRFDLMRPMVGEKVGRDQARQKEHHDTRARFRQFAVGTRVMVREGRDNDMEAWYHTRAPGSCVLSGPDGWGPDATEACGPHSRIVYSTCGDHIRGSYRTIHC